MPPSTRLLLGFALLLYAPLALAQANLGELLDAGAKKLSAEEFRDELVQRMIVGPTATGSNLELMYASNGTIQGIGGVPTVPTAPNFAAAFAGEWKVDDNGRVCTNMRITGGIGGGIAALPVRCQFWFKYKDVYFLADSDIDRQARVLRRTKKQ